MLSKMSISLVVKSAVIEFKFSPPVVTDPWTVTLLFTRVESNIIFPLPLARMSKSSSLDCVSITLFLMLIFYRPK